MVELEKQGVPTVIFTAQAFEGDAHQSAKTFGVTGLPLAVVPLPFSNQSPEGIEKMVDDAFDQVVAGLTRAVTASDTETVEGSAMSDEETIPYWSCALCGEPVAPFAGAVWLSDVAVLCVKCGKTHNDNQETLPAIDTDASGSKDK